MLQTLCWFIFWERIPSTNKIVTEKECAGVCWHHFECWATCRILEYIIWFLWMVSRVIKTYRKMDNKKTSHQHLFTISSPELHAVLPAMFVNKNYLQYNHAQIPLQNVQKWPHGFFPRTSEFLGELLVQTTGSLKKTIVGFVNKLVGQRGNTHVLPRNSPNSHMTENHGFS